MKKRNDVHEDLILVASKVVFAVLVVAAAKIAQLISKR